MSGSILKSKLLYISYIILYIDYIMISDEAKNKCIGKLLRTPLESFSMNNLSKLTNISYVTMFNMVPVLEKKEIIKTEKKGKSTLININLEEADINTLSKAMINEREIFLKKNIEISILCDDINKNLENRFYSLMLFGSYAKGINKQNPDIDILFIIPDNENEEEYKKEIDKALKMHKKVNYILVKTNDFKEMLNIKNTVGREAFRNNIILFGVETYYMMVKNYVRNKGY